MSYKSKNAGNKYFRGFNALEDVFKKVPSTKVQNAALERINLLNFEC